MCAPSPIAQSLILEGTDSGEGVDNGVTLGNGDDDVEGPVPDGEGVDATTGVGEDVVGEMSLLDWDGMFVVLGHGKDVAAGTTFSEIGVWLGVEEDVCAEVGDGEGTCAICAFGGGGIFTLSTYRGLLRFITPFPLFWVDK